MSLKRFYLVSSFAKVLAILPWSLYGKNTFTQKVHSFLIILIVTSTTVSGIIFRNFYSSHIHIKISICILSDLSLFAINVMSVLNLTFRKRHKWLKLLNNLISTTTNETKVCNGRLPYYSLFLFYNVSVISLWTYEAFIWIRGENFAFFFKVFGIAFFQKYCEIIYAIVLWEIVDVLLLRYKQVNKLINSFSNKSLQKATHTIHVLNQSIDIFNDVFGWSMNIMAIFTSLMIINYIDYAYLKSFHLNTNNKLLGLMICDVIGAAHTLMGIVIFIFKCDSLMTEATNIVNLCRKLGWSNFRNVYKEDIEDLGDLVAKHLPKITAARFYDINRRTLLQMLWSVISILVVMIQFRTTLKAY